MAPLASFSLVGTGHMAAAYLPGHLGTPPPSMGPQEVGGGRLRDTNPVCLKGSGLTVLGAAEGTPSTVLPRMLGS